MVSTGCYDVVLALGVEKLYHADKQRTFLALRGGMDVEEMESMLASFAADESGAGGAPEALVEVTSAPSPWTSTRTWREPTCGSTGPPWSSWPGSRPRTPCTGA